jgi:putative tricarboxylic transport membrane protein
MLNRNVVFPSIIILLSAMVFSVISKFDSPIYQDASVSAKFFPTVIVIAQIIICALLIVQHKLNDLKYKQEPFISKMSIFGVGFIIGYALLISMVGYLYASLASFVLYLLFFKIKKTTYYIVAVVFVVAVNYLFGEVFYISLPQPMWL